MDITHNDKRARYLTQWSKWLCLPAMAVAQGAWAGWDLFPQVTVQEVYTDNVELADEGLEQGDFVTELTPRVTVRGRGMRYRADLNYALQGLIYADDSGRNDINHLITGEGQLEWFRDHGFLDVAVDRGPQNIGINGVVPIDNISVASRPDVFNYSITPNWRQQFGNFALGTIGYTWDQVLVNSDALAESQQHTVRGSLESGPHYTAFGWRFDALEQYLDDEDADDIIRFRNVTGRVDYHLTPHWSVIGQLGYDDNRFGDLGSDGEGVLWGGGLRWSPSRRTAFEFIGGERYFGHTYSASAEHTGRRWRMIANYAETPTTARTVLLRNTTFAVRDAFGQPVIDPTTGQPQLLDVAVPVQTAEVLISRLFDSTIGYIGRYHDFEVGFTHEDRDYDITGDTEEVMAATIEWRWRFTPRTSSRLAFSWTDESNRADDESRFGVIDFGITRRFGRTVEATLGGRYLNRDTTGVLPEYDESRAFLLLVKRFD
jgi:uncharacterized protein (PEP-CTERM system associated)